MCDVSLIMIAPALAALLLATPPCAGDGHNQHRSASAKRIFRHARPCPAGPDRGSVRHCRGYVIDHICPLACCGLDAPQNMQWQTKAEAKAKDRWELDCGRSCGWTKQTASHPGESR